MPTRKPKGPADVASLARSHTKGCIKVLSGIMYQEDAATASRIAACNSLLDRGYGKAMQSLELQGEAGLAINIVRFTEAVEMGAHAPTIEHESTPKDVQSNENSTLARTQAHSSVDPKDI